MRCNKKMCTWLIGVRQYLAKSSCVVLFKNHTLFKKLNLATDDICGESGKQLAKKIPALAEVF